MAFDFGSPNDSSDDEAVADISAWQAGAKTQRATPPRRTSGFQAVNQPPPEDIAMQSTPEPEPEPAPVRQTAPVAQMQPATEPTVISSGEESSSDDEEEDAPVAPAALPIEVEDNENDVWATLDQVVGGFAVVEDEEPPQAQQPSEQHSDSGEESDTLSNPTPKVQLDSEEDSDDPSNSTPTVEVVIPRNELDDDERAEYVDFTTGGDVVRRVLAERQDSDGMMEYTVGFEDYHMDEVRFACDLTTCEGSYNPQPCRLSLNTATPPTTGA